MLFFFMKALEKRFRKHIITILKKVEVAHTSDESHYSLFMVFSTFRHFPGYQVLDPEFEVSILAFVLYFLCNNPVR